MALLERVTLLIKANLNDLVEKAEQPEKLLRQLLLDMQNQFMQVKTQLAMAIANQHLLQQKERENRDTHKQWLRKAELAVEKGQEDMAREAVERALTHESAATNFAEQVADQSTQVQTLRDALHRLELKMSETRAKSDLLLAQHRKARLAARAGQSPSGAVVPEAELDRVRGKVAVAEAAQAGTTALNEATLEQRFEALEKAERVDQLLESLKARLRQAS